MRRRMMRKREMAAAAAAAGGEDETTVEGLQRATERKELETALLGAEAEIEAEMRGVTENYDTMQEKFASGLKKRFIYEKKAAKAKGAALSDDERKECLREAADAIKSRFERDQKALMESLEGEHSNQRRRLLKALAAKKAKCAPGDTAAIAELENAARKELQRLDANFSEQATAALSRPQGDMMFALSAIYLDDNVLEGMGKKERKANDDEDEDDDDFTAARRLQKQQEATSKA